MRRALADRRFVFGFYASPVSGQPEYGIVPVPGDGKEDSSDEHNDTDDADNDEHNGQTASSLAPSSGPFLALTVGYRLALMALLAGLLAFVLHRLGAFLATNRFGARALLAGLGVLVTFGWTALFLSVAAALPFCAMARRPQPPERSVLLGRLTNEFSGLTEAVRLCLTGRADRQRHLHRRGRGHVREVVVPPAILGAVALMTLLAEFLPALLANVPYSVTQTRPAAVVCARLVAAILVLMLAVLAASFVVCRGGGGGGDDARWPALPADPRTIAGAMYYVTDSHSGWMDLLDGTEDVEAAVDRVVLDGYDTAEGEPVTKE
ncbi:hypothetical protein SPI_04929 [Niveomyces insectorum RCEF 264]|uniref:Uncharacterized protein n=1 Tax=Niveomyces insectorum RCEF 264 TaxID=1081102 RepID=A0A167UZR0_9HYPO|nr:hypothetical protein SPI_04929 [Niveomyces insectorum RCEF 264]